MENSNSAELNHFQDNDQQRALEQLEALGNWLDSSIPIPGLNFKIGWDTLIGLVPGVGDAVSAALASWIVLRAKQLGVSKWTVARMIGNVGIDALLGSIPLVGDIFDATYKANNKNIALLRRQLAKQTRRATANTNREPANRTVPSLSKPGHESA